MSRRRCGPKFSHYIVRCLKRQYRKALFNLLPESSGYILVGATIKYLKLIDYNILFIIDVQYIFYITKTFADLTDSKCSKTAHGCGFFSC